jgi:hypothetical protein
MQSTTVLAFRIFVMLSCLILVPMAAIFGSAFPDVVKSLLVDRIVEWSTGKSPEAAHDEAGHGFGTVSPAQHGAIGPGSDTRGSDAPRWDAQPTGGAPQAQPAAPPDGVVAAGGPSVYLPADNQQAAYTSAVDPNLMAGPLARPPSEATAPNGPIPQPLGLTTGVAGAPERGATPEQPDRFTAMERKLREYGATYYLLETWGNEGELYRFHCKMAVGNNPNYTRHFEATDRDALQAMSQVLERVESWRASRPH